MIIIPNLVNNVVSPSSSLLIILYIVILVSKKERPYPIDIPNVNNVV
jgi:hypothetical protein